MTYRYCVGENSSPWDNPPSPVNYGQLLLLIEQRDLRILISVRQIWPRFSDQHFSTCDTKGKYKIGCDFRFPLVVRYSAADIFTLLHMFML